MPAPKRRDEEEEESTEEADSEGSGSSGERTFTQKQLNDILAGHKRELRKELDLYRKENEELKQRLSDHEDSLLEVVGGPERVQEFIDSGGLEGAFEDGDGDEDGYYGDDGEVVDGGVHPVNAESVQTLIRGMNKRHQAMLASLNKRLEQEIKVREDLERKGLERERDRALTEALVKNNVVDVNAGVKLLRDQMEYDPDKEAWLFKTKDGLFMQPDEGVADSLPDFLRRPMGGPGGSGSRGANGNVNKVQSELTRKQEELKGLEAKAQRTGNSEDIAKFQRANREIKDLQSSLTGNAGTNRTPANQAPTGR